MYSAGLHVAMGKFALGMDVVYHLREKKNKQVRDNQRKAMKVWNMHNAMLLEVQQVRLQNKDTHQLTVAQLKTMVKWFRRDGDEPMPQKKNELITRYDATKDRGERPPPPPPPAPPAQQDDGEDEDNDDDDNSDVEAEVGEV